MELGDMGWGGMDWIDLARDRDQWRALVNTVMNLRVPQNAGKFLSCCATGGFSRKARFHGVSMTNVKSSLSLVKHYAMTTCGQLEYNPMH
jgi:hypothetical protein